MVEIVEPKAMSWKAFLQLALLIILGAGAFYVVYPKYQHGFDLPYRANKITGKVEYWMKGEWYTLENKDKDNFFKKIKVISFLKK
jgi:hypothetical protein